jgi:transketolase
MVSVAAALAREGFETWAYSIAPFCYARPFEQIRNDVTFHKLPVKLVGNGGGYGYGVMGPTHHAIEDYGILLTLSHIQAFIPVFDEDLYEVVERVGGSDKPAYLRLGRGEPPPNYVVPPYSPWRQLLQGSGATVIAVGPLASTYIAPFEQLPETIRPNLWAIAELPLEKNPLPVALLDQIENGHSLCVAEEHVRRGSFGEELISHLVQQKVSIKTFQHCFAKAHQYDRYGSQSYLRKQSGLDPAAVIAAFSLACG